MRFSKYLIAALLLACTPVAWAEVRDDLQPPDWDFFLEAQGLRTDLDAFGLDANTSVRLRAGALFNDARLGNWIWGVEGAISNLADSNQQYTYTTPPGPFDPVDLIQRIHDANATLEINGFELGARLFDRRFLYLRSGLFVHTRKSRIEETITRDFDVGADDSYEAVPESESTSDISVYLGAGVIVPVVSGIGLTAEYNAYRIDSEIIDTFAAGVQLKF